MKWKEIIKKFKDEWVLIEVKEDDENYQIKEGIVIAHSRDKSEIYEQLSPSHYFIIFITIILPFLFSLFCAAAISRIGHRLALIDNPNIRSSHSLPTPKGGGIGVWLAFVIIGLLIIKDNAFTLIAGIAGLL